MAAAAIAGMGALVVRYYVTDSIVEATLLRNVMKKGIELDGERRQDQAVRIISELARALKAKGN
jgi:hypothetical protein